VPGETAQTMPLGTRTAYCRGHQVSMETSQPKIVHDGLNRTEWVPAQNGGLSNCGPTLPAPAQLHV